jgi:hypothetical protein
LQLLFVGSIAMSRHHQKFWTHNKTPNETSKYFFRMFVEGCFSFSFEKLFSRTVLDSLCFKLFVNVFVLRTENKRLNIGFVLTTICTGNNMFIFSINFQIANNHL